MPTGIQLCAKPQSSMGPYPGQNGKVERFNRTLAAEWAYRQPFPSKQAWAAALTP
jgi:transposase InsO family protein